MSQLQPTKAIPVEKVLSFAAVTIANGGTVSSDIICNGLALVGIQLPAALTGIALTFKGSVDGTTFQPIYDTTSGTALSYTVAAGHYVAVDPAPFQGLKALQIVSGSAEGAARSFTVSLKGF